MLLAAATQPLYARSGSIPAVMLDAPEGVREVLRQHFPLPDTLLRDAQARATFMRRAQREIPELLATEGYFGAAVVLRKVNNAGVLELEVKPGTRTRVAAVEIELRGALSREPQRAQALRATWLLPPGSPFRAADWDDAKAELLARVSGEDFAAAHLVGSAAEVDVAAATAHLRVVIDSGARYAFGAMQIAGLERYEPLLLERHAPFKPGDAYRRSLLLDFQAKLQKLPQFSSVILRLDTAAAQPGADGRLTAPVRVEVVEAQSRKLSLGVGYSTNHGVRNEINYQSYNFLNRAWLLKGAATAEQNQQNMTLALDTPPNPLGYWLSWRTGVDKTQVQGLETRRDKFGVTRSRTEFDIENGIGLNWQQERRLPQGGIRETDQALVLDWHWYRRVVDNPLAPMDGALTELKLGGASKSILSDQNFVRSYARHQSWIALGANDVLSLRIEGGYTASTSRLGIPQEYLFRVGGTQTVRGFAYQSLGFEEGGAIVGGRVMSTLSTEYTHWFGNWGTALFVDAGGAADTAPTLKLSTGYGFGARWKSPVGPFALDWARGKGEPETRIHFAIAVAF
ncbi:MAG: autotransporter assembly complex family protein [Sideroxydans sp.]